MLHAHQYSINDKIEMYAKTPIIHTVLRVNTGSMFVGNLDMPSSCRIAMDSYF
jgi:hypothetical protein